MSEPTQSVPGEVPRCANCGAPVPERFCGRCGQERRTLRIAFGEVVGESLSEALSLDSKIARTVGALVFRPGEPTRRYLDGKRASQTSPVKLYLLLSFLYFFIGALTPSDMRVSAGGSEDEERGVGVHVGQGGTQELRSWGPFGARLADRIDAFTKLPPEQARRRLGASLSESTPRAMFFLVPVLAALLAVFYARSGFFFAEHVVTALHVHALAFLLLIPGEIVGSSGLSTAGMLAAGLHSTAALRRVYGKSWGGTLWRAAGIGTLYLVALGLALAVVVLLAIWTA